MTHSETKLLLAPIAQVREDLSLLQRAMKTDFPATERIPFFLLKKQLKSESMQGFFLSNGTEKFGYIIVQPLEKEQIVYIHYLAIFSHIRAKGYGSIILGLLAERLPEYTMVLEVEHPAYAKDNAEKDVREKRTRFYNKNGFSVVPGVQIRVLGNVMQVMSNKTETILDWGDFIKSFFVNATGSLIMRGFLKVFVKVVIE